MAVMMVEGMAGVGWEMASLAILFLYPTPTTNTSNHPTTTTSYFLPLPFHSIPHTYTLPLDTHLTLYHSVPIHHSTSSPSPLLQLPILSFPLLPFLLTTIQSPLHIHPACPNSHAPPHPPYPSPTLP